jgi:hypothetical protein
MKQIIQEKLAWDSPNWFRIKVFKRRIKANVNDFQRKEKDRQRKYIVTMRSVSVTIVAVEKQ